ncbi:MAG: ABC transporter permease [Patescibacteria group bacterium]
MTFFKEVARLTKIYLKIFRQTILYILEYRFNTFVRSFYGPIYHFAIFVSSYIVYSQNPSLGGWSKEQGMTIFFVFNFMFSLMYFLFFEGGLRRMMWTAVRNGEIDNWMTKPVPIQFSQMMFHPSIDMTIGTLIATGLLAFQLNRISEMLSLVNLSIFLLSLIISFLILYFVFSSYATLSFYMTKSQQIGEIINKASDISAFPTTIFPGALQLTFFFVIPVAFIAYVPSCYLFGKADWKLTLYMIVLLIFSFIINRIAWKEGLKRYSSVSN